jgi:hypothetical protein
MAPDDARPCSEFPSDATSHSQSCRHFLSASAGIIPLAVGSTFHCAVVAWYAVTRPPRGKCEGDGKLVGDLTLKLSGQPITARPGDYWNDDSRSHPPRHRQRRPAYRPGTRQAPQPPPSRSDARNAQRKLKSSGVASCPHRSPSRSFSASPPAVVGVLFHVVRAAMPRCSGRRDPAVPQLSRRSHWLSSESPKCNPSRIETDEQGVDGARGAGPWFHVKHIPGFRPCRGI